MQRGRGELGWLVRRSACPQRRPWEPRSAPAVTARPAPLAFLCHSSADKPYVQRLDGRLRGDGIRTWLDERDIARDQPSWVRPKGDSTRPRRRGSATAGGGLRHPRQDRTVRRARPCQRVAVGRSPQARWVQPVAGFDFGRTLPGALERPVQPSRRTAVIRRILPGNRRNGSVPARAAVSVGGESLDARARQQPPVDHGRPGGLVEELPSAAAVARLDPIVPGSRAGARRSTSPSWPCRSATISA